MTNMSSQPLMGSVKYEEGLDFRKVLNKSLSVFFKDALRVAQSNPSQALSFSEDHKVAAECGSYQV